MYTITQKMFFWIISFLDPRYGTYLQMIYWKTASQLIEYVQDIVLVFWYVVGTTVPVINKMLKIHDNIPPIAGVIADWIKHKCTGKLEVFIMAGGSCWYLRLPLTCMSVCAYMFMTQFFTSGWWVYVAVSKCSCLYCVSDCFLLIVVTDYECVTTIVVVVILFIYSTVASCH